VPLAPEPHRPTPFVGRSAELRRLLEARSRAAAGRGQAVLLSGDAGIGKSRIVRELRPRRPHTLLWHRCSPEHALSPLHPVIGLLQDLPGLPDAEMLEQRLMADGQASGGPCGSTLQRLRSRTFEVLLARIEQLARQQMVVAVYEDLQWADPSTLEFLDRMVEAIASLPVLAIMTFRPEFEAAWQHHAHAVPLALAALKCGPCRAMVHHLSAGETLAEPTVEHIVARSGGVPLLVEELTRAALEVADALGPGESTDATPAVAIPSTLHEALITRLEPASAATTILQAGAVIGCEFSAELLAAVVGWPQNQLQTALDQLVASDLISRCGPDREGACVFRHALIRDAAYHGIAEPLRRKLHGSIAQVLEGRPEVAASTPEVLAQHYSAAGLVEPAVAWWLRAGKRASERCAHGEAVAMLGKGLDLLDALPAASEAAAQRAQLLAALAQALTATKGLAAPEVAQACGMARTLFQSAGQDADQGAEENARLFPAVRSLWEYYNTRGELETACELAEQCQKLAAGAQDRSLVADADFCFGVSALFAGRLAEGRERLNRNVVSFEARGRRNLAASEARDPRIIALVHLAQALWLCG
jgi:predicted ATPase